MSETPTQRRDLTPEEQEVRRKIARKERTQLVRDLGEAFSTPAGRRALRYLMDQCGYQKSNVFGDPVTKELLTQSMLFNEARRDIYLGLREYIPTEVLIAVEVRGLGDDQEEIDVFS